MIVPGDANASQFYRLIDHTAKPYMPKKEEKLSGEAIDQIAKWINGGAPYDEALTDADYKGERSRESGRGEKR